jgi:hypothetical protein
LHRFAIYYYHFHLLVYEAATRLRGFTLYSVVQNEVLASPKFRFVPTCIFLMGELEKSLATLQSNQTAGLIWHENSQFSLAINISDYLPVLRACEQHGKQF